MSPRHHAPTLTRPSAKLDAAALCTLVIVIALTALWPALSLSLQLLRREPSITMRQSVDASLMGTSTLASPTLATTEAVEPRVKEPSLVEPRIIEPRVIDQSFAPPNILELWSRSIAWAVAASMVGVLLAWIPSRVMRSALASSDARGATSRASSLFGTTRATTSLSTNQADASPTRVHSEHGSRGTLATLTSPFASVPSALIALLSLTLLLPLSLPPWVLSGAMWIAAGPGTAIGDWCERTDRVSALRLAILCIALIAWSMALGLVVLMCAGAPSRVSTQRLLALDDASLFARVRVAFAQDARACALAVLVASTFLLGETTVFDLAQVSTIGFELRTMDALGASPRALLVSAWPGIVIALITVFIASVVARRMSDEQLPARGSRAHTQRESWWSRACCGLAALLVLAPLALYVQALSNAPRVEDFLTLHGIALRNTVFIALLAAVVVALVAVALRVALASQRRWIRRVAITLAMLSCVSALVPGTITATALATAYNHAATALIYDSSWIVVFALASRAMIVAVAVSVVLFMRETAVAGKLRALDSSTCVNQMRGLRREARLAFVTTLLLSSAWNLGELITSGRVLPPGVAWLATDILNAIHYQRPDTVLLGTLALLLTSLIAVAALGALMRFPLHALRYNSIRSARVLRVIPLLVCALAVIVFDSGCDERAPRALDATAFMNEEERREHNAIVAAAPNVDAPLQDAQAIGVAGRGAGQFNTPRALACDPRDGTVYVIDKDARVQHLTQNGELLAQWRMPKFDRGKPVGATVAPDGTLVVADTHEHRIVAFAPDGTIRWTLGEYGRETGQFIYPTDIAFAPDGRMFIGEYGGNDRIQVFDRERRFLYAFGRCGALEGEFLRPQALAYDSARDELYIADVGNHRIQVFTGDGEFRRALGSPGRGPGEFAYPFGLILEIDGVPVTSITQPTAATEDVARRTVVVAEHSNHRVQRLDAISGKPLALAGGVGAAVGRLKYPWALEPCALEPCALEPGALESSATSTNAPRRMAICDSGNSRIVFFVLPQ